MIEWMRGSSMSRSSPSISSSPWRRWGAKFNLHGNALNLFGGDLNQACQELAKGKWEPLGDLIESAIASPGFHRTVSAYFREEVALSGFTEEDFDSFQSFLVNDEKYRGGMMTAYLLAYARILRSVTGEKAEATDFISVLTNSFSMFGWLSHLEATTNFSKALADQLQDATYEGGNPDDLPIEPFVK